VSGAREVDVVVVGAGVVGLAAAAALARNGRSVWILERHDAIARETTSRNSEVVHAGLYYPPGSLKAVLCVEGREALYRRCRERGIPHRRLGKLVVATSAAEVPVLERILATGRSNGVPGLELVDGPAVSALEPEVAAVAALLSPDSGIVDAHALALSYLAEAEQHGAVLLPRTTLRAARRDGGGWSLGVLDADGDDASVRCAAWVNAAGLEGDRVAGLAGLDPDAAGLRLHPCKGDYFALAPGAGFAFRRLVYPVPAGAGLGVHVTLDLGGRIRLGPDAEYVAGPGYAVDPGKAKAFADAARRYLPRIREEWLQPDYAGIRPKLAGPGEGFRDFVVREESQAGLPGLVNLVGIESPGLTAAGAIAERVVELLRAL